MGIDHGQDARATRTELIRQATRLTETLLAESPGNPMADEAGMALVANAFELGDHAGMIKVAEQFARIHPASPLRDSFRYSEALGYFHLGQLDRAIAAARAIVGPDARPQGETPEARALVSQAIALLGRIHEARLEPAEALAYYRRIAARVPDAADAVEALTAKSLSVPEIAVVRPEAPAGARRAALPLDVTYRNLTELDVRVYPVDLLRLFPGRDDLGAVASVNLAGIRPVHQAKVAVGDGRTVNLAGRVRRVELPIDGEGAYLVMLRGDDRFASGLVVLTPMELEVTPSPESGRIRIAVRDARTRRGVPGAQVKVIGSRTPAVQSGETDLRGVFVADAIEGRLTVVARSGPAKFAIHRSPAEDDRAAPARRAPSRAPGADDSDGDLRTLSRQGRERQIQRLEKRGMGGMGGGMGAV